MNRLSPLREGYRTGIRTAVMLMCAAGAGSAGVGDNLSISGANDARILIDRGDDHLDRYLNDWTDLTIDYADMISLQLGYEAHLPPPPKSFSSRTEQGIMRRSLTFRKNGLALTAGTFDAQLGHGLTLRSYTNRDINWNSDIDGITIGYLGSRIEATAIGGRPRDLDGNRQPPLAAGGVRFAPTPQTYAGVTYVGTRSQRTDVAAYWGSVLAGATLPMLEVHGEFAAREFAEDDARLGRLIGDYADALPQGKAAWAMAAVNVRSLSIMLEAKHYSLFNLHDGAIYNAPPLVAQEHLFSLFSRKQLVQQASDEKGFMASLSYNLLQQAILSASFSHTSNLRGELRYRDIYAQGEFEFPAGISWIAGTGYIKDASSGNFSLGATTTVPLNERYSLKPQFEHQHSTITVSQRKYYSQEYGLSLSRAPGLSVGGMVQLTTDQTEHSDMQAGRLKAWGGVLLKWNFLETNDLSLFAGTRRKGKICAGGVCMEKPDLRGIELFLTSAF